MLPLARRNDVSLLRREMAERASVSIHGFLAAVDAERVWNELETTENWLEIFRAGELVYEMPRSSFEELDSDRRVRLDRMVLDAAKHSLQYRYRAVRLSEDPEERAQRGSLADRFADLLNSSAALDLFRAVTGNEVIAFADAQATDFRAGDFLTAHDDNAEGKNRLFAYVYSLTRNWQADWGGLLMFEHEDRVHGYIPDFNVLRLFAVPSKHHVSYVAPWVEARRLSITGWLRCA
jgi:SM-20-related protein